MKNVDGQTDVGHINLIDGLVTRNPPKNWLPSSLTSHKFIGIKNWPPKILLGWKIGLPKFYLIRKTHCKCYSSV